MKLDPNAYRRTLDAMKPQIIACAGDERKLTEMGVVCHVPLLAIVMYTMRADVLGGDALVPMADRLKAFYGYKEVLEWLS